MSQKTDTVSCLDMSVAGSGSQVAKICYNDTVCDLEGGI